MVGVKWDEIAGVAKEVKKRVSDRRTYNQDVLCQLDVHPYILEERHRIPWFTCFFPPWDSTWREYAMRSRACEALSCEFECCIIDQSVF
jgi:hypothetical protein